MTCTAGGRSSTGWTSRRAKIDCVRIDNDPVEFAKEVSKAPKGSDVVIEATYGWYWAVDLLQDLGYEVHLSNPHGNDWGHRRVKNDERDARDLADLLRLGRLAEAWIAPPTTRELRELVRFRFKLSNLRTGLKAQAHAVMAKNGILPVRQRHVGRGGTAQFDSLELPDAFDHRIAVLRDLVRYLRPRDRSAGPRPSTPPVDDDAGYNAVQAIYGVGQGLRRRLRGRDRRRPPLRLPPGAVLVGRAHPHAPGVRRQGPPGQDHQARLPPGALGGHRGGGPLPRRRTVHRKVPTPSPSGAARPEPTWRSPAKFSRSSTTACETARSAVSQSQRRRDARTRPGASSAIGKAPISSRWRSRLSD